MEKYTRTVIDDISTVNVDQDAQAEQWAQILGVTHEELRNAVAVVGTSAAAVRRYLRRRVPGVLELSHGAPSRVFAEDGNAQRAALLLEQLRTSPHDRKKVSDELGLLVPRLITAIHDERLVLDYAPADPQVAALPGYDDPHYLQSLLYWAIRLQVSLPRLIEAHARVNGEPTVAALRELFERIEEEEAELDAVDIRPRHSTSHEGCLPEGIYKVVFITDSRSLGDGVCIVRDDQVVGANFGYAVSGAATRDGDALVLTARFIRQHGYESPLGLPVTFELVLRGSAREDGFELHATLPATDVGVQISGRRISP